jgi:hypothetical protein
MMLSLQIFCSLSAGIHLTTLSHLFIIDTNVLDLFFFHISVIDPLNLSNHKYLYVVKLFYIDL